MNVVPQSSFTTSFSRRSLLGGGLAALAAAGLGGSLTACSSGSGQSSTGTVTLTHWDWWVSQAPWIEDEMQRFAGTGGGAQIKRTLNQFDQYSNLISLSQRSKTLPDTYMIPFQPNLQTQVSAGWLTPLNDYVDEAWLKSFPKYSFVEGNNMFDGKIYTTPLTGRGPIYQLYINNQVFRDAGLVDPAGAVRIPQTWDEVGQFASTITAKSNGSVYGLGMGNSGGSITNAWLNTLVLPAGTPGGFLGMDYRTGRYAFGEDRNYADVIGLLKEWWDQKLFDPASLSVTDEISRAHFAAGKFGMTVAGSYAIQPWVAEGFTDFSMTTLVGPTAERRGFFYFSPGGKSIGVSSDTEHPQEAAAWVKWWAGPEAGARLSQQYGIDLSVYPENNDPAKIESEPFGQYAALADLTRLQPDPVVRDPSAATVAGFSVTPSIGDIIVGSLTGQVKDTGAALTKLGDESDAQLDQAIADAQEAGSGVTRDTYVFSDWDVTQDYAYDIPEYPAL